MFKKREHKWTDKAAGKIAGAGIKVQAKFASGMNRVFATISMKKMKSFLVLSSIVCGGYSVYLIAHAIFGSDLQQPSFKVKQMNIPKHLNRNGSEVNEPGDHVSDEVFFEIQRHKRYMDSMKMDIRPGLMDSIKVLEQIYQSQK